VEKSDVGSMIFYRRYRRLSAYGKRRGIDELLELRGEVGVCCGQKSGRRMFLFVFGEFCESIDEASFTVLGGSVESVNSNLVVFIQSPQSTPFFVEARQGGLR
jgi:hypothetical protein